MGLESASDDGTYGYAAVEILFSGSPDDTYTASQSICPIVRLRLQLRVLAILYNLLL